MRVPSPRCLDAACLDAFFFSLLAIAMALVLGAPASAQTPPAEADPPSEILERYLTDHDLSSVLGAHLRERLRTGTQKEMLVAAEALGDLYVRELKRITDPAQRQDLEAKAKELLKSVPESRSYALRLELAKATYVQAEELAERARLRMGVPEDRAEAERILRSITGIFADIAQRLNRRADEVESQERHASDEDVADLRRQLGEARALHALARYYAGWASYYLAFVTDEPKSASDAIVHFGTLLGAPANKPATVDKASRTMLRSDAVARAAMGCALAESLRGNHREARRWLDLVEDAEEIAPSVRAQLFSRRVMVFAAAASWSDLEALVRSHQRASDGSRPPPLNIADARLIAVVSLEALDRGRTPEGHRPFTERLAKLALGDLAARREVGHVLDLLDRFGSAQIGDEGFVAQLVRGLHAYDAARKAHRAADAKPDQPTKDPALINQYRAAAKMLEQAVASPDGAEYAAEVARARLRLGLSLYYAGDVEEAATRFEKAFDQSPAGEAKRDALWYAISSLDLAVEGGKPSLAASRDRLAMLMIQTYPGSEYAARLLLRQTNADAVDPEQGVKILLGVKRDSPAYFAARRQASQLLYRLYARATPNDKAFAAVRFAEVAEEAIEGAKGEAMADTDKLAQESAAWVVRCARQLADALLSLPAPELRRVEAALDALDAAVDKHRITLDDSTQTELLFRRFQIATAKNDATAQDRALAELRRRPGPYALAADRALFKRAQAAWRTAPSDPVAPKQIVTHGLVIIERTKDDDPALPALRAAVAEAAAAVFAANKDEAMRDRALELDKKSVAAGGRTEGVLRRLAELSESKGETQVALDAWRDLSAGLVPSSLGWYEARYNTIRLLGLLTPGAAREAMRQHVTLHPNYGPEPWGKKLKELDEQLPAGVATPPAAPATPTKPGGGG